jgi:hypothetical protein
MADKTQPENPVKKAIRLLDEMFDEIQLLKEIEARKAAEIEAAIPEDVKFAIAKIEANYSEPLAQQKQVFSSIEGQVRSYILELGLKKIVGKGLTAIRSDGKPQWDTKALKKFFDKLPTLLPEFYKEGTAFVTIRKR